MSLPFRSKPKATAPTPTEGQPAPAPESVIVTCKACNGTGLTLVGAAHDLCNGTGVQRV